MLTAVTLLLTVYGCSRPVEPASDAKGGDGVLRLSLPGEPRTLNPNVAPLDEYALLVTQNLFSRLVTRADDSGVLPELAERWTESADGLTYTFYIRKGVRFHDGTPLTAEDVRTTFARIAESSNTDVAQHIASVEAPDPTTVHVRLKAPWAAFIPSIAWYGVSILPSHVYASAPWKDNPANTKPIGSGPFKLKTWEPGRRIVLEKNRDFFGQGPYVDELDYAIVPSTADGVELLLEGQVDFVVGRPPPTMVRQLTRTPGLRVTMAPGDGRSYLAFNLRRQPFADRRLRRAVNLALDRRGLVDDVLSGLGSPAVGFYTPAVAWAYNAEARVPNRDPAEAGRIVNELKPAVVRFAFPATPDAKPTPMGTAIVKQLEAVGFRIQTVPIPPAQYLPRLLTGRDFDMVILSGGHGPDPDSMTSRFGSAGSLQVMGYANAELDRVLDRGRSLIDPAARAAEYYRAQAILAEDLPIAPLFESMRIAVHRDGLRGVPHEDARGLVADYTFNLIRMPNK